MYKHRLVLAIGLSLVGPSMTLADIVYSGAALPLETFDSLPTVDSAAIFSATIGVQAAIPGSTGFDGAKIAGTGTSAQVLRADNGSVSSGGLYSYGATSVAERALGSLASGTNTFGFGFALRNDSANTITEITVSFTQENWRQGANANTTSAAWATSAVGGVTTANYLTASGFTAVTALDLSLGSGTNGALDGNLLANQVARTFTFPSLTINTGDRFYLRWRDSDSTGNDAGLAMDNLTLTITAIPEASAFLFAGLVGVVLGAGRLARKLWS